MAICFCGYCKYRVTRAALIMISETVPTNALQCNIAVRIYQPRLTTECSVEVSLDRLAVVIDGVVS